MVWALLPAAPARAATHEVKVGDFYFTPKRTQAAAGDTVVFSFVSGIHDVTAYSGASFSSGLQGAGTFEVPFDGGTVLYHCTPHSTLSGDPPVCTGMCGVITDEAVQGIPAPTVRTPSQGALTPRAPNISGTASVEAEAEVEVREGLYSLGRATVTGGSWWLSVPLEAGEHTIYAVAITADDDSPPSAPVTFTVDAVDPAARIVTPTDLSVVGRSLEATGTAGDASGVASVVVKATNRVTGAVSRAYASCTGCGSPEATWRAQMGLPSGLYLIEALATDLPGNTGTSEPVTALVTV